MNIYTISQPGKQIVDVQGVAIRTENVSTQIPPPLPTQFASRAVRPDGTVLGATATLTSWSYPFLEVIPSGSFCRYRMRGTNQFGQPIQTGIGSNQFICGTEFIIPGLTTVTRCDIIVTVQNSPLQEIRLQGLNSQPCGTWTTRSLDDCRDTEIKCNDPSNPSGFCCIPCDTLNTKLRTLIL